MVFKWRSAPALATGTYCTKYFLRADTGRPLSIWPVWIGRFKFLIWVAISAFLPLLVPAMCRALKSFHLSRDRPISEFLKLIVSPILKFAGGSASGHRRWEEPPVRIIGFSTRPILADRVYLRSPGNLAGLKLLPLLRSSRDFQNPLRSPRLTLKGPNMKFWTTRRLNSGRKSPPYHWNYMKTPVENRIQRNFWST